MKFNLSGCWEDNELPKSFSFKNYRRAMRHLVDISKKYFFFTTDYIDYLEDLNNSVLSSELTPTISMTKISDAPFSKRIKNALPRQGIYTIGELSHYTIAEISRFRGLGETSQKEIKRVLKTIYGINLLLWSATLLYFNGVALFYKKIPLIKLFCLIRRLLK